MTTATQRDAIIKKVQALRARAADAASTESEAAIAARKAQQLLDQHNLSLTELDVRAEGIVRQRWDSGTSSRPLAVFAGAGIDRACNTKSMYARGVISIVGAPADVEVALYYYDLVQTAAFACWRAFQRTNEYFRLRERGVGARSIGDSFRKGVAVRLGERIRAQAADAGAAAESSGDNALIIVKDQLIQRFLADNGVQMRKARSAAVGHGYSAGLAAGDNVGLRRGVGSSRAERLRLA